MKQFLLILLSFSLFFQLQAGDIEKIFQFQKPSVHQINEYQILGFKNLVWTGKSGEPLLPYQDVKLLLPPGEMAVSIEFEGSGKESLTGFYQLYPRQSSRPLSDPGNGEFLKNNILYSTDADYPYSFTGELTTGYMNGYAVAMSTFTPVVFNPVTGSLSYYKTVKITIRTAPSVKSSQALANLTASERTEERVKKYVQNPEGIKQYAGPEKSNEDYQLLIITAGQFEDDFEEYTNIYLERGFKSEIVTTETINASSTGQDLQEKIRNYIIGEYQDHNIEFVLLGGDVEHVPYRGFYCYVQSGGGYTDNNIPADLYYSALDGTWNDDNDNLWGEIGEDDLLPEVAVARFSFSDLTELGNMIHKTQSYQNEPVPGEFNDAVLAGEWLYGNPETWGSDYLELLIGYQDENGYETWGIPEEYDFYKLYEEVSSWGASDLIAEINAGRQFIHHVGHANSTYVAYMSNSTITNANFSGANGVDHNYTLFFSHGCICGAFDDNDCIMEKMVSIENFAVSVIGNSRYGWFNEGQTEGPAQHLHRELVDAMYHERMNHLGAAFMESKIQTAPWVTAPGQWEEGALRWNFYDINILGDPALSVWTAEPISINVDHSGTFVLGTGSYDVTVTSDGMPMENFRCVLLFEGAICGVGITNEEGSAAIATNGLTVPGDAQLVVSGYNCLPAYEEVTVIPAGATYVHYIDHILDDAAGNGNGKVDFGESNLLLDVTLENLGIEAAENVETTLTSSCPYVTITDALAVFGSIDPNGTVTVNSAFGFDVAGNIPDQYPVEFQITISWGEEKEEVVNFFSETANAPALTIGTLQVDDSEFGNGNGIPDPGETVILSIDATNEGHSACSNTIGTLFTAAPGITLINTSVDLGVLNAGETKSALFTVEVDEVVPPGTSVELEVELNSGPYGAQHTFALSVGLIVEDFETGDFSAYNWEFGGNADWAVTSQNPYEGNFSAKSGSIGDQQSTELIISLDVLADGEISFYRKVSSEADYDYLRFYVDNTLQDEWAGEESWALEAFPVSSGNHTFKWMYEKDYSVSSGADGAWVDYIVFPPAAGFANVLAVNASATPGAICEGESSQLNAFAAGGSGTYTYSWDPVQGLDNPTIAGPVASPEETTTYTVTVSDGDDAVQDQVTLVVNDKPATPTIAQEDDHLVSSASEGNQWYGSNGPVAGATGQFFYPVTTDYYYAKVENAFGCESDPSNAVYFVVTSLSVQMDIKMEVYPNPTSGKTEISFGGPVMNADIRIFNFMGEQIMQLKRNFGNGVPVTLDLSDRQKGIYFIRVNTGSVGITTKITLQ